METIGHEDVLDIKAVGENFSADMDDFINGTPVGMRGLFEGASEHTSSTSAAEPSSTAEADASADTIEWDPTDLLGHA